MKLLWTRRARDDLTEIALYIARDKLNAALDWVQNLQDRAETIPESPRAFRMVPEYDRDDIREMITGNYRTVFKIESARIVILTVFEGHKQLELDPDEPPGQDETE